MIHLTAPDFLGVRPLHLWESHASAARLARDDDKPHSMTGNSFGVSQLGRRSGLALSFEGYADLRSTGHRRVLGKHAPSNQYRWRFM